MNTKHAQYVLTVLQEGSITNAARKLFVSQPSLSQMIKLAENNLGAPIFNRNTDPITLTYAGQKYVEAAKQVLAIDSNLAREIEEITHEEQGTIRLGIPVQRAMQVMPYVFPRFRKLFPMVKLELNEFGSATVENMVLEGALDLACTTTSPRHEELHYTLIENEELVLLSGRNTAIAKRIPSGTEISISEAKGESFISSKSGHSVRTTQDRLFAMYDIQPDILLETSSIEVAKRTTIASDGVMICPINYIEMSPELHPYCCIYPIKGIENQRGFYLCHRKDFYLTKYMKSFIQLLTTMEKPVLH
ncbi:MAG: LysR family transcriptional regulator [Hungatella sp.]|nr:LysR family transcriptional regulator [Hungatella sp.]